MQAVFLPARETQGLKNTFGGKPYFKQPFNNDPIDPSEDVESDDVDLDVFVDIINKTGSGLAMTATDHLAARGSDLGKFMTNVGGIREFSGDHKTPIMKGMVPNITYRSNKKGPGFSTQSAATYITNRPAIRTGTLHGTAKSPLPKREDDLEPAFNLEDLIKKSQEPSLHQFNKQRKKIKEVMSLLE